MHHSFRGALIATIFSTTFLTAPAHAANYGLSEERVEQIVQDYIKENPDLILQSIRDWQTAQQEQQQANRGELVKQHLDEIYNSPHSPSVGPKDAALTLVEFFDYNCPACKTFFSSVQKVIDKNPGNLRVIFKEFPIFGPVSNDNARIAMTINFIAPDKYFPWHEKMMNHRGRADKALALKFASEVGIDQAELDKNLNHPDVNAALIKDLELARTLQLPGTPSVVIGDRLMNSALPVSELQFLLDQAIELKNNATQ